VNFLFWRVAIYFKKITSQNNESRGRADSHAEIYKGSVKKTGDANLSLGLESNAGL
jgi:hypothetical protein